MSEALRKKEIYIYRVHFYYADKFNENTHTHGEFQAQFIYCHWHKYGDTNECDENKQLKGNPQKRNVHILEGKKTIFNDIGAECEGVYRAMTTPNDKMQCKEVKLWHMKHTFSK